MRVLQMSLLQMSVSAAVMIFVITVIRALAINRLPKMTFTVLWGIVLARLLVPFSLPSPLSVYSLIRHVGEGTAAGMVPAGAAQIADGFPVVPAGTPIPAASAQTAAAASWLKMPLWAWIWGIGFLLCGLYFTAAYIRCRCRFMTSQRVENDFTVQWLTEHRCKRPLTIRQSSRVPSPLTYGYLRPVILMPAGTDWEDTKELQYVLAHEYVHIRRFDGVTKFFLTAALCIHWFNPLVWVMYLLANRDIELSCDEKVVRMFGEAMKSAYALALIGMEEKKSGLTPLCSHFSKNAIEERVEAIMRVKKMTVYSLAAACAVVLVIGSTFATSAAEHTQDDLKDESGKETEAAAPYGYSFRPDPQIYSRYSAFGIAVSDDGAALLHNGQRVRLFVDEHSEEEAFFLDEAGIQNLQVVHGASGNIEGIESISGRRAQEYRAAFFAGDTKPDVEVYETEQAAAGEMENDTESETEQEAVSEKVNETEQEKTGSGKLKQYSAFGITLSQDGEVMYYNGQRVRLFVDERSDGDFVTFWLDEAGTVSLSAVRDTTGQVTAVEGISEEKAQKYLAAANQKRQYQPDQAALDELEERVEKRMKERYSDR